MLALLGGAAASNGATLGFDIQLNYINPPTVDQAAAFASAEATWESIITGYQIDDIFNTVVVIDVDLGPIDGAGGTVSYASPSTAKLNLAQNAVTSTFLYTSTGSIGFDTADILGLGAAFEGYILHEIGDVLGIGSLWSSSAVGFAGRQELYTSGTGQYTGAFGLAAYNAEFDQVGTFVPVELGGGGEFPDMHWNEVDGGGVNTGIVSNITGKDFQDELMTGWLGGDTFISTLTTESLRDLGYTVVPEPTVGLLVLLGCLPMFRRNRLYNFFGILL